MKRLRYSHFEREVELNQQFKTSIPAKLN